MNTETKKPLTLKKKTGKILTNPKPASGRSTEQARIARNRATKRIPLKDQQSLDFEQDSRYRYREVIDRGGRIAQHKTAGYELVEKTATSDSVRSKDASTLGKYKIGRASGRERG